MTHSDHSHGPAEFPGYVDDDAGHPIETGNERSALTRYAEIDPSLRGYHWHSVVAQRGWEQPTLDGGNGGHDPAEWLWRSTHTAQRRLPIPLAQNHEAPAR